MYIHPHTMDYYSSIKNNEILPLAVCTWTDLENIMLSEIRQKEKPSYYITHMWNLKNSTNEYIYKIETYS